MKFILQLLSLVYLVIFLHELGHTIAALSFGLTVSNFQIGLFELFSFNLYSTTVTFGILPIAGFIKIVDYSIYEWQNVIIYLAGPTVNLAFMLLLKKSERTLVLKEFFNSIKFTPIKIKRSLDFSLWNLFLTLNTMLFVFNMIPLLPLDGGKIIMSLLLYFISPQSATYLIIYNCSIALGLGFIIYTLVKPIITKLHYSSYKKTIDKLLINSMEIDNIDEIKREMLELELYGIYLYGDLQWMSYENLFYKSYTKEFKDVTLLLLINKTGVYASS